MSVDLVVIREMARQKEDENWRFRRFLKEQCDLEPEQLDNRVFEITNRVWAGIDCKDCANCCRHLKPSFSELDVDRLAKHLGVEREAVIKKYLEPAEPEEDANWRTNALPCPFLEANLCTIYDARPGDCRGYPYLYEADFASRTMGMIERTSTCPIVYEVFEELKKELKFRLTTRR